MKILIVIGIIYAIFLVTMLILHIIHRYQMRKYDAEFSEWCERIRKEEKEKANETK